MKKRNQQRSDQEQNEHRHEPVFRKIFQALDNALPDIARLLRNFDPLAPRTTFAEGKKRLGSYTASNSVNGRLLLYLIKPCSETSITVAE